MIDLNLHAALPEIWIAVSAMVLLLIGAYTGDRAMRLIGLLSIAVMVIAIVAMLGIDVSIVPQLAFGGHFIVDSFGVFAKVLALIAAIVSVWMSFSYAEREGMARFELPLLMLLATLGMMLMVSANDLISLYVGLELQSLALYVTAAIRRDTVKSTEAGLKYFVLGALSSGMLLYGASLIYGFVGTVSFAGIAKAAGQGGIGLIFGLVFLFAGFCFKVSAVPFHMWTPDVYEGAPTPVTAFFAAAPKVAGMAVFVRASVAASNRDNSKSVEAGLKYFVLGALSSGMLLYGASLIYGFTGIAAAAKTGSTGIVFGLVFLLAGLCFKVSAVPFHMWTPDVYEGAPTPVTAFFASAPKVAALAVFTRVALTAFPGIVLEWQQIVVFVAIASMVLGSFAAIGQTNIKRLMAY